MYRFQAGIASIVLVLGALFVQVAFADEFPLRKDFPGLKTMTTAELADRLDRGDAVVIDVRSDFEFATIRVDGAHLVPLAKKTFANDLEAHRAKDAATPLVFYCNGTTCAKSYRAAKKAEEAGFANCYVYDAGIFAWTKTHPEKAYLMGSTPADPAKLISKEALRQKTLDFESFKSKATEADALVVDIRDPVQRKVRLEVGKERNIPLDRFHNVLDRGDMKDKQLLIYDAVGKQVRWLMYHLEDKGYTNYAFLDGGVRKAIGDKKHF
jgi:rhodanese-related sulfurtransferase